MPGHLMYRAVHMRWIALAAVLSLGQTALGANVGTRQGQSGALVGSAAPGALTLPLELLSDGDKPYQVETTLHLNAADLAAATTLAFTCHRCAFFDAPEWEKTTRTPTAVKASVRVLGGQEASQDAQVPWVDITDKTVDMPAAEKYQGGLTVSGLYTARLWLPLDADTRKRLVAGANRIQFRFNGTDGESNGYRILQLDFVNANKKGLSTDPVAQADIGKEKQESYAAADIQAGRNLWSKGNGYLTKSSIVPRKINAACASCHAEGGRDLQYFNYSNNAIAQRARFHGLSETEAQLIVAYVRANTAGAVHVPQAAPWNPPYQPGPGLDSKPIQQWAAGAGLGMVLETPVQAFNALAGVDPHGPAKAPDQKTIYRVLHPATEQNAREMATSLQFPDWNAWLPSISPEDVWPDNPPVATPGFTGSFNQGGTATGNARPGYVYQPRQVLQAADNWLAANKGSTWGDWSHLSDAQRKQAYNLMQPIGWTAAFFNGGGRSNRIAGAGKVFAAQAGAANLMHYRDNATSALNPQGTNDHSFIERATLSIVQWSLVQQWSLAQKHGLEGSQKPFLGKYGEARGWALQTPGAFSVAPHLAYQDTPIPGTRTLRKMILQWEDNDRPVGSYYRSNIWYDLAMVLNAGAKLQNANYPVDWNYHTIFSQMLSSEVLRTAAPGSDAEALAKAHMWREVQVRAKFGEQVYNDIPMKIDGDDAPTNEKTQSGGGYTHNGGRAGAIAQIIPATWVLEASEDQPSRFERLGEDTYRMVVNGSFQQFDQLLGVSSGRPVSDWRRCDPNAFVLNGMEPYHFGAPWPHCMDHLRGTVMKLANGKLTLNPTRLTPPPS